MGRRGPAFEATSIAQAHVEPPFLKRWLDPSTRGGRAPEMPKTFSFLKIEDRRYFGAESLWLVIDGKNRYKTTRQVCVLSNVISRKLSIRLIHLLPP